MSARTNRYTEETVKGTVHNLSRLSGLNYEIDWPAPGLINLYVKYESGTRGTLITCARSKRELVETVDAIINVFHAIEVKKVQEQVRQKQIAKNESA